MEKNRNDKHYREQIGKGVHCPFDKHSILSGPDDGFHR